LKRNFLKNIIPDKIIMVYQQVIIK